MGGGFKGREIYSCFTETEKRSFALHSLRKVIQRVAGTGKCGVSLPKPVALRDSLCISSAELKKVWLEQNCFSPATSATRSGDLCHNKACFQIPALL